MREAVRARVHVAPGVDATPAQRFERKFFVTPQNLGFAYALLRQVCRPDAEYPEGRVTSLYFDTPDLDQYSRSVSGDSRKRKVRIRWYGDNDKQQTAAPVFLELKSREGFASSKQRRRLSVPSECLEPPRLGTGIVDKRTLIDTLAEFGHYPEAPLLPVILIRYRRHRFNEMQTGTRVSLDWGIRSSAVSRELGHAARQLWLQGGVIEVKGPTLELPATLRRMRFLDTDWSRFSKYSYCVETHLSDPGTVGWLWPSGRTVEP